MHFYLSALVALIISGCSLTTTTPPIQQYALTQSKHLETSEHPCTQSLQLSAIRSDLLLNSKSIRYQHEDGRSGAYLYSQWSESPVTMIEKIQLSAIEKRSILQTVIPATSLAKPTFRLESELHSFHHLIHKDNTSEGVMEISGRLIDTQTKSVIAAKRFTITAESKSHHANDGVSALNQTAALYSLSLAEWINDAMKGKCK